MRGTSILRQIKKSPTKQDCIRQIVATFCEITIIGYGVLEKLFLDNNIYVVGVVGETILFYNF